jgi:periplasmic copper chaperone A
MRYALLAVLAALPLAGCQPPPPEVEDVWIRLNAIPDRPAAGYFKVESSVRGGTIVAVRTAGATRVEFHESMANGMKAMRTVGIPAGEPLAFAPGGRHLMLFGVSPSVQPGREVKVEFEFGDGTTQTVEAEVVGAADPAP